MVVCAALRHTCLFSLLLKLSFLLFHVSKKFFNYSRVQFLNLQQFRHVAYQRNISKLSLLSSSFDDEATRDEIREISFVRMRNSFLFVSTIYFLQVLSFCKVY